MKSFGIAAAVALALAGTASAQFVTINEFYYDAPSTDDGKVFAELHGPAGTDISGWRLTNVQGASAASCGQYTNTVIFPANSFIGPDGLFVVADLSGAGVTSVVCDANHNGGVPDYLAGNMDFENGPDAVHLIDAGGGLIDSLNYGITLCTVDTVNGFGIGEGAPAPDVFSGFSLERFPAGFDTFNNATDFFVNGAPTPGASLAPPASLVYTNVGGVGNTISLTTGGQLDLAVNVAQPNEQYLILVSVTAPTGNDPLGVPFDPVTDLFLTLSTIPNPLVTNFVGNLSAQGQATATLLLPAGIAALPATIPFYFVALSPVTANGTKTNVVTFNLAP